MHRGGDDDDGEKGEVEIFEKRREKVRIQPVVSRGVLGYLCVGALFVYKRSAKSETNMT